MDKNLEKLSLADRVTAIKLMTNNNILLIYKGDNGDALFYFETKSTFKNYLHFYSGSDKRITYTTSTLPYPSVDIFEYLIENTNTPSSNVKTFTDFKEKIDNKLNESAKRVNPECFLLATFAYSFLSLNNDEKEKAINYFYDVVVKREGKVRDKRFFSIISMIDECEYAKTTFIKKHGGDNFYDLRSDFSISEFNNLTKTQFYFDLMVRKCFDNCGMLHQYYFDETDERFKNLPLDLFYKVATNYPNYIKFEYIYDRNEYFENYEKNKEYIPFKYLSQDPYYSLFLKKIKEKLGENAGYHFAIDVFNKTLSVSNLIRLYENYGAEETVNQQVLRLLNTPNTKTVYKILTNNKVTKTSLNSLDKKTLNLMVKYVKNSVNKDVFADFLESNIDRIAKRKDGHKEIVDYLLLLYQVSPIDYQKLLLRSDIKSYANNSTRIREFMLREMINSNTLDKLKLKEYKE